MNGSVAAIALELSVAAYLFLPFGLVLTVAVLAARRRSALYASVGFIIGISCLIYNWQIGLAGALFDGSAGHESQLVLVAQALLIALFALTITAGLLAVNYARLRTNRAS